MLRQLTAGAALAMMFGMLSATPASAEGPPQPTAAYGGSVVAGPGAIVVKITYTCNSSISSVNHLFVAVKQGPQIDTGAHSSSDFAVSFYSTNWKSDAGPNALRCNGVRHTQAVVLKKQPVAFWPPSATQPPVHAGSALVQICVFDNIVGGDVETGTPLGSALDYTIEQVHAGHGIG